MSRKGHIGEVSTDPMTLNAITIVDTPSFATKASLATTATTPFTQSFG